MVIDGAVRLGEEGKAVCVAQKVDIQGFRTSSRSTVEIRG